MVVFQIQNQSARLVVDGNGHGLLPHYHYHSHNHKHCHRQQVCCRHTCNITHSTTTTSSVSVPPGHLTTTTRRSLLLLSTTLSVPVSPLLPCSAADPPFPSLDTTITDRVFLDFSICATFFRVQPQDQVQVQAQDVSPSSSPCPEPVLIGRVVLGLYGKLVPITVSNFKAMCTGSAGSSYKNTLVHKLLPGQFFMAGHQGRREKGEVPPPPPSGLVRNTETVESRAFMLQHSRPGVLSLCLAQNDDDDDIKLNPDYHNVEFLITTGPGPAPQLDGNNIVFGTVLQGMDVITQIASTPTYKPAERIRQLNDLAGFLGDERAQNARALWNRPLKTIYISDCGELQVAKPSLSPSLP